MLLAASHFILISMVMVMQWKDEEDGYPLVVHCSCWCTRVVFIPQPWAWQRLSFPKPSGRSRGRATSAASKMIMRGKAKLVFCLATSSAKTMTVIRPSLSNIGMAAALSSTTTTTTAENSDSTTFAERFFGSKKPAQVLKRRRRLSPQEALNAIASEKDPEKVVSLFMEASEHSRFHHYRSVYEVVVKKLANAGRRDAVHKILEHETSLVLSPQNPRHSQAQGLMVRIMTLYGRAGMPDAALHRFESLYNSHPAFTTNVKIFNALLSALLLNKRHEQVRVLFSDFSRKFGVVPNLVTFNLLFKSLCADGKSEDALAMIDSEMSKHGCVPDAETFNVVLRGFCSEGRDQDAPRLLHKMEQNGLTPDLDTYNTLIVSLCKTNKSAEAKRLLNTMRSQGIRPNTFSYNTLIRGFCLEGDLSEAENIISDMTARGCQANSQSYLTFLYFLCVREQFERALQVFYACLAKNWVPKIDTVKLLVEGLVRDGKVENARKAIADAKVRIPEAHGSIQHWQELGRKIYV